MIIKKKLKKFTISEQKNIYQLIKHINDNGFGFAIILDKYQKVTRIFTDGDIRRILLKKIDLKRTIYSFPKKKFKFIHDKINNYELYANRSAYFRNCSQIPIIDNKKKLKSILVKDRFVEKEKRNISIFILAGGKGTRMGSLTKKIPKPMLKISNKTILEHIVSSFKNHGFLNFIFSVNYLSKKIIKKFKNGKNFDVNISYIKEKNFLGTAGSLTLVNKNKLSEDFYITNGDIFSNLDYMNILKKHKENKNDLTIIARLHFYDLPYGLITNERSTILTEKPKLTYFVNSGIYIMKKKILDYLPKGKYLDMNDLINFLKKNKFKIGINNVLEDVYDVGDKNKYINLRKNFKIYNND